MRDSFVVSLFGDDFLPPLTLFATHNYLQDDDEVVAMVAGSVACSRKVAVKPFPVVFACLLRTHNYLEYWWWCGWGQARLRGVPVGFFRWSLPTYS